ncbi:MAG: hypothetical protein KKE20_02425 [Nanoarchaeota archaeon]|nr:hypothetical protein [Nanoarchaeota archaeon]
MTEKKGQVTFFIIIGIILILAMIIIGLHTSSTPVEEQSEELSQTPLVRFVESCLGQTAQDALIFISSRGGFYGLPSESTEESLVQTAYWKIISEPRIPTREMISVEVSDYIDDNIEYCLGNFSEFRRMGYDITARDPNTQLIINEDTASLSLEYPIKLAKDDGIIEVSSFAKEIDARQFNDLLYTSEMLTSAMPEEGVCVTCLKEIEKDTDTYIKYLVSGNSTVIFAVNANNQKEPNRFVFAIEFNEPEGIKIP